ncbi:MAG TPA: Ig domain-containing protein [Candidatus Tectomicrobia bacterium]|nr:Ig domain-containing protein [Candidatus Tectomicrobia bacterium]
MEIARTGLLTAFATILVLATAAGLAASAAQAQDYTFTVIADTAGSAPYTNFGVPAINGSGQVTFSATDGVNGVVLRGDGGALTVIATVPDPTVDLQPSIDALGRVIFQHPDGRIVSGDGGALVTRVAPGDPIQFGNGSGTCDVVIRIGRTVGDDGDFLVLCGFANSPGGGNTGLYLSEGPLLTRICDEGTDTSGFPIFPFCATQAPGGVSSGAQRAAVVFPIDTSLPWSSAIAGGSGVALSPLVLNTGGPGFTLFQEVAINESRTLAFSAVPSGEIHPSVFVGGVNSATRVTLPAPPGTVGFVAAFTPSINNSGGLVFEADVQTATGDVAHGVYTGSDPVLDRVIQTGDILLAVSPSAVVRHVVVGNRGINDAGQIVFVVDLGFGFRAVVRADPVGSPPSVVNPGNQTTPQGAPVSLAIQATDPDGDPLTYTDGGTLPAGLQINSLTGLITGTPTTMGTSSVTITVSDGGHATGVTFDWTVTGPAPAPRTDLTATPDLVNAAIALAWNNPTPDTATVIEVNVTLAGIPERVIRLAAGTASHLFLGGNFGQQFCFTVVGVSDLGVRSDPSNVACAVNPSLEIVNLQVTPTATTASIAWTTNMPATGMVLVGLAGQGFGDPVQAQSSAGGTQHAVSLTGLIPGANYALEVLSQSIASGQLVTVSRQFTTPATGPLAPRLRIRAVDPRARVTEVDLDAHTKIGVIDIVVTNLSNATATAEAGAISPQTTLEWSCPSCSSTSMVRQLRSPTPLPLGTLAPGGSAVVRLEFAIQPGDFDEAAFGPVWPARLHVVIAHQFFDGVRTVSSAPTFDLTVRLDDR